MTIQIPQAQETVGYRTAKVDAPQLSRPIQSAFGEQAAEAEQKLGAAVSGLGAALASRLIERQQVDEEQQVMSVHNDFNLRLQNVLLDPEADESGRPKGVLARRLDQAKGSTTDLDAQYVALRQEYLDKVPQERQKVALGARLDNEYATARGSVIRHEAAQGNDAFKVQFGTTLERDPALAQSILDSHKKNLPPAMAESLQTEIDGKMLDVRRNAAWAAASGVRHPDGTIDLAGAEAAAAKALEGQELLPGQADHIRDFVRQQASVADAVLRDKREADDRAFINDAIKMARSGAPVQETVDTLLKQKGYGFDTADKFQKEQQIYALYRKDDSFYDDAIKKMTPQQKLAWDQIETMASGKWGNKEITLPGSDVKQKVRDTFLTEMKQQVIGLSPEQMLKKADDALQKVVVSPGWFMDTKRPRYQVAAGERFQGALRSAAESQAISAIAKDLGDSNSAASKAQSWLRTNKKDESPATILMLLQRDPSGAQSWNPPAPGKAAPAAPKAAGAGVAVTMNDQQNAGFQWGSK